MPSGVIIGLHAACHIETEHGTHPPQAALPSCPRLHALFQAAHQPGQRKTMHCCCESASCLFPHSLCRVGQICKKGCEAFAAQQSSKLKAISFSGLANLQDNTPRPQRCCIATSEPALPSSARHLNRSKHSHVPPASLHHASTVQPSRTCH